MEKTQKEQDISKGLDSKTVEVIRERLKRWASQGNSRYSCYYNNDIQIGWIINKPNIFIYNNFNVYYEIKLHSKASNADATQVNIINNESGTFILLWDGKTLYTRKINEEYDMLYFSVDVKSLARDERIATLHLINSKASAIPEIAAVTTTGRLITFHVYIDEETLSVEERVIEAPKKLFSSLTNFLTGGIIEESNFHRIQSDLKDDNTCLFCFGAKSINVWTLSSNAHNLWRINIEQIFRGGDHEAGEIKEFNIIGEEVTPSDEKYSRLLTLIVQIKSWRNENEKNFYTFHFIMKLGIDLQKQTYEIKMVEQLIDANPYSKDDENVKCLVCSNDSSMTYVFLIYEERAKWINVFDKDMSEDLIDYTILGYGLMENRVKNFLLYFGTDIKIFSLLREQRFELLAKNYLQDIEHNCILRKKIQEANFDSVINKLEGDDERKILDMLRSFHDNSKIYIHLHQNELVSLMNSRGAKAFEDIVEGIIKKLVDLPIQDNMIYEVFREDVEDENKLRYSPSDMGMIAWSLSTKLKRLSILKNFLWDSEVDFNLNIRWAEEKVVFLSSIKRNHDEIWRDQDSHYQCKEILNQAIQEVVKNVHLVSKNEIKQKGTTSSLIFYSMPLKSADKFIYTLSKIMYERRMKESLEEETLLYLSLIILDGLESIQNHRKASLEEDNATSNILLWTMNIQDIIDPIKRVIELMPEVIRSNECLNLVRRMKQLWNALLTELRSAATIESLSDNDEEMLQYFLFSRDKLICMFDEFSPELAIELAYDFKDVINTTRLGVVLQNYSYLHRLFAEMEGSQRFNEIQDSMDWIVNDYKCRLKAGDKNSKYTEKLNLFEIFEDR